ncbi:zinc finger MYND domain-containing protein 15 isoform X1 [Orcinus orca]|uniref:zinc finger MYND domain-containing protein 15 isoform X1 n=1 Tax=Orcinus orca TaxID=9733 RepID=UPI001442A0F6|nr:zinc finger MYND domain-containing protein 15 isoform X1 [Orcinus orca]
MTQPQTLPSTSLSPYIPPSAQSGPRPCFPEDMEFVSGYRDEFLDFVALLFGWFRKFVAERGAVRTSPEGCWWQLEAQIRRLPQDRALWVLHVLPNRSVGISLGQGAEPGPAPGLGAARLLGDEPPLHLRDLSPYVSFVSLEEGGEEEGAGTEKVETEADGKPAPTSRESPREAKPPGEADGAQQEAAGGEVGCQEDRAEDKPGPERRKGQRSEAAPLHLSCLLLVTDEHGTILGIDLLTDGGQGSAGRGSGTQNLAPRAYALLCHSMACPMGSGDPRKPRKLTVGDAQLHRELENLVPRLKVKLTKTPMRTWGPRPGFTFASLRARNCHVCHRHSFEVKLTPCPQCGAVLYCGEACLQADWKRCPDDVSHRFWCPRLAAFMERAGELATLPFTYTAEVTSETFNKEAFLASRGLTRGYWTQLSMLIPGPGTLGHPRGSTPSLSVLLNGDPYQLLQGDGPALMPPVPPDPPRGLFGSWQDYYTWRGLSLDSPMAVLLTYPLTMYYVITHLVPQSFPELNIQNKQSLKIHVMEAGKEFDLIMVFWELLVLLPNVALELQFVGDSLPPESDQQNFTLQRVRAEGGALLFSPNPPAVLPAGLCPSDPCLLSPVLPDASPSTKTSTGFSTPLQTPQDDLEVSVRPGSGVSARLSSGTKEKGGRRDLQIKVSARPYHLLQGPKPDLVIGHLAELAAPVTVPPSAGLLHREQRVRLCDGRPDHGGGHGRGHQPSTAQPFPLPLSPQSGGQLYALVRPSCSLATHPERSTATLVSAVLGPSWPSPTPCFRRAHSHHPRWRVSTTPTHPSLDPAHKNLSNSSFPSPAPPPPPGPNPSAKKSQVTLGLAEP